MNDKPDQNAKDPARQSPAELESVKPKDYPQAEQTQVDRPEKRR